MLLSWLASCGNPPPKVTLHTVDINNGVYYPYKIKDYDSKTCTLKLENKPAIYMNDPKAKNMICVTAEDYAKLQAYGKTECENNK